MTGESNEVQQEQLIPKENCFEAVSYLYRMVIRTTDPVRKEMLFERIKVIGTYIRENYPKEGYVPEPIESDSEPEPLLEERDEDTEIYDGDVQVY